MLTIKSDTSAIEGVDLDTFATMRARLAEGEVDAAAVATSLSLADVATWHHIERAWLDRAASSEHVAAVLELLVEDRRCELAARRSQSGAAGVTGAHTATQADARELPSFMRNESRAALQTSPAESTPGAACAGAVTTPPSPLELGRLRDYPSQGPMPFQGPATPERLTSPRAKAQAPPTAQIAGADETAIVLPTDATHALPSLPFMPSPTPRADGAAASRSPVMATTAPLDLEAMRNALVRGATPFRGATSPERLSEVRQASIAPQSPSLPGADETAMVLPDAAIRALQALPFAGSSAPAAAPDLTVDVYAALAAEIEARGASPDLLARYGVTSPAALVALRAEQDRRFAADPGQRARFEERRAHFLSFMREPRR